MAFGYFPHRREPFVRGLAKRLLGWTSITRRLQAPIVMRYLNPQGNEVVLDVGASSGPYTVEIAREAKLAVAIEYEVQRFGHLSKVKGFGGRLAACTADALKLPFADRIVDKVLLSGTLQSLNAQNALIECARVLKPGGSLVLVVLADHPLIRNLYTHAKNREPGFLLRLAGVPDSYAEFKEEYCRRRQMTRYYTGEDLRQLLSGLGFRLEASQYVPAGLAATMLDLHHLLTWKSGTSWIGDWRFFLLSYPFFWLAQFMAGRSRLGSELVSKFSKYARQG